MAGVFAAEGARRRAAVKPLLDQRPGLYALTSATRPWRQGEFEPVPTSTLTAVYPLFLTFHRILSVYCPLLHCLASVGLPTMVVFALLHPPSSPLGFHLGFPPWGSAAPATVMRWSSPSGHG